MTRVFVADEKPEERTALRLLLLDLEMEVVGEAADWAETLALAPVSRTDMHWKNYAMLVRPRWLSFSSVILMLVTRRHFPPE
jgi:hypothetical protein